MNVTHEDIIALRRMTEEAVEAAMWNFFKRLYDLKTVDEVIDRIGEKQLSDDTHR